MIHLDHADVIDDWLPTREHTSADTAHIQVAHVSKSLLALRNSADPTGPALVVPHSAVLGFIEAMRAGAIDGVLGRALTAHPTWCTGLESPGGRHRSSVLPAYRPDDPTEVRIWLMRPLGVAYEHVMISFEEADRDRKALVFTDRRIARFMSVTEQLERLAADLDSRVRRDGVSHPRWCVGRGIELPGEQHRSGLMAISRHDVMAEIDLEAIDMQLVETVSESWEPAHPTLVRLGAGNKRSHSSWTLALHQLPLIRQVLAEVTYWRSQATDRM